MKSNDKYEYKYLLLLLHNEFLNYESSDSKLKDIVNRKIGDYKLDMYAIPNTELRNHHKYIFLEV